MHAPDASSRHGPAGADTMGVVDRAVRSLRRRLTASVADPALRRRYDTLRRRVTPPAARLAAEHRRVGLLVAVTVRPGSFCVDIGATDDTALDAVVRIAPGVAHLVVASSERRAAMLRERHPNCDVRVVDPATQQLDGLLEGRQPAFVRIDIGPTTRAVLEGSVSMLRTTMPVIVIGLRRTATDHTDIDRISDLLGGAGYRIFDLDGQGAFDRDELAVRTADGAAHTFVAVPPA